MRAEVAGFIDRINVEEGEAVRRGAVIATLRNPDLERKREDLRSQLALLEQRIRVKQAIGETADIIETTRRRAQLEQTLHESEALLARLRVTSPADGIVLSRNISERIGVMLKPGDEFCELAGEGPRRIRVTVDDWDLQDVQVGSRAALRVNSSRGQELEGRVVSVAQASNLFHHFSTASSETAHAVETDTLSMTPVAFRPPGSSSPTRSLSTRAQAEAVNEAASPFDVPLTRFEAVIAIDARGARGARERERRT